MRIPTNNVFVRALGILSITLCPGDAGLNACLDDRLGHPTRVHADHDSELNARYQTIELIKGISGSLEYHTGCDHSYRELALTDRASEGLIEFANTDVTPNFLHAFTHAPGSFSIWNGVLSLLSPEQQTTGLAGC